MCCGRLGRVGYGEAATERRTVPPRRALPVVLKESGAKAVHLAATEHG